MTPKHATIVADLGFGDAGKGTTVDFLARQGRVSAVVRFNGGAQAAHNVITPDGRHHTFSQFGSGTFVPGVRTHLSRFMLVDLYALRDEAAALSQLGCHDPLSRLSIDEDALLVSPYHRCANMVREALRSRHHGTCGMGIGETMAHSLAFPDQVVRAGDIRNPDRFREKHERIREHFCEEFKPSLEMLDRTTRGHYASALCDTNFASAWTQDMLQFGGALQIRSGDYLRQLAREGNLLFEGAQGTLLDEWYGFHPHTTWSTTTFDNALALLREIGYEGDVKKLGVLRAYQTRHGAGPFVTEDAELTRRLPEAHNGDKGWQRQFRVGWFDAVMARYALEVCGGADGLVLTHLDCLAKLPQWKLCTAYRVGEDKLSSILKKQTLTDLSHQEALTRLLGSVSPIYERAEAEPDKYIQTIEQALNTPVTIASFGPTALDKRIRAKASIAA